MTKYYFDLCDGREGASDEVGTELRDDWAAIAEAYEIARELMRNADHSWRLCCISVRDETGASLFEVPLVAVDERLDVRFPEGRVLIERACELRRNVREAIYALAKTRRQSAALIARSRGRPYLAAIGDERVL